MGHYWTRNITHQFFLCPQPGINFLSWESEFGFGTLWDTDAFIVLIFFYLFIIQSEILVDKIFLKFKNLILKIKLKLNHKYKIFNF